MAKPQRLLLAREARRPGARQIAGEQFEVVAPLALGERVLELELSIEMIFDDGLVATRDEDEMLDPRCSCLIHDVLDERTVDHRKHLLGHGLGCRQEPGSEPCDGEDGFSNGLHRSSGERPRPGGFPSPVPDRLGLHKDPCWKRKPAPIFNLTFSSRYYGVGGRPVRSARTGGPSIGGTTALRLTSCGFIKGFAAAAGLGLSLWLMMPAQAQFFDWGGSRRYDPFRDLFAPRYAPRDRGWDRGEGSYDFSHAPAPAAKKPEATTSIVVMGDANADWLAYGLEDAFAEKPEIAIVRKHRTDSGLIRYDPRRDSEWAQVAREIIAAEKPKYIVMMIGNNDRQSIREKAPPPVRPGAANAAGTKSNATQSAQQSAQPAPPAPKAQEIDPEAQPPEHPTEQVPANLTPEQSRGKGRHHLCRHLGRLCRRERPLLTARTGLRGPNPPPAFRGRRIFYQIRRSQARPLRGARD